MIRLRAALGAMAVTCVAMLPATAISANASAEHSTSPVIEFAEIFGGGTPTPVGFSSLVRNDNGVTTELSTSALAPGDVVTLWWVVFNEPDGCQAGIPGVSNCGPADAMQGRGGASALRATGRIADNNGTASYGAHLRVGDASHALFGDGLLDARNAEVILVLKTHGPKIPGLVPDQLHTFAGGCADQSDAPPGTPAHLIGAPGPNDCAEIQVSVHSPNN